MKVPYRWLLEFVPIEATPEEIAGRLTMLGLEIAEIHDPAKALDGVVAAEILGMRPHPNADRLTLCQVNTGSEELEVVCGASNMNTGDKVVFAPIGITLPNRLTLKPVKIRGVASHGMLCAEDELGLSEDHSGIIILPPDTKPGIPAARALGMDDPVIEVELTANRGDCLSILGIAREVAAAYGVELTEPPTAVENEAGEKATDAASIRIDDADLCSRYTGRVVKGITVGPSPDWMQRRLEQCDVRAINNIVDITNYVLLERGHPLHAFDLHRLDEASIIVRRAKAGEEIASLDDITRKLEPEMLVIADANKPVAIAGVMGGANSEVTEKTVDLLIESAHFEPVSVRKTSKRLALSTEASYRFERGTDYDNVAAACDRCARLIAEIAGGQVLSGRIDVKAGDPPARTEIRFRPAKANHLLGLEIPAEEMRSILRSLGFEVGPEQEDAHVVTVPRWRNDVALEADLIEEVARYHGYNKVRGSLPSGRPSPTDGEIVPFATRLRRLLCGCGLTEMVTPSFMADTDVARFKLPAATPIPLANPMSTKENVMRTSLLPGLLRGVDENHRNGNLDVALFEIGHIFQAGQNGKSTLETTRLGLVLAGEVPPNWSTEARQVDFFDLKGVLETLADQLDLELEWKPASLEFLHPGRAAEVVSNKQTLGYCGELHPALADEGDYRGAVVVAELDMAPLQIQWAERTVAFRRPSVYPSATRDLAVVVPKDIPAGNLEQTLRDAGGNILENVVLFDQYMDERIGKNMRSLAFRMTFRSSEGTLKEEEVNKRYQKAVRSLEHKHGAKIRD